MKTTKIIGRVVKRVISKKKYISSSIYLTEPLYKKLERMHERTGLTKSAIMSLLIKNADAKILSELLNEKIK
jgi:hypothetical protein